MNDRIEDEVQIPDENFSVDDTVGIQSKRQSIFKRKNRKGFSNSECRTYWIDRKNSLSFSTAVVTAFLISLGLDWLDPIARIETLISLNSTHGAEIIEAIENAKTELLTTTIGEASVKNFNVLALTGGTLIVGVILYQLIRRQFDSNSPFSDSYFLRAGYYKDGAKALRFPFNVIAKDSVYYAKYCPSNALTSRCDGCGTNDCGNRLKSGSIKSQRRWNTVITAVPTSRLDMMLEMLHHYRVSVAARYKYFITASILSIAYLVVRLTEAVFLTDRFDPQWGLLALIILFWVYVYLLCHWSKHHETSTRRELSKFETAVSQMTSGESYRKIHDKLICSHDLHSNLFTSLEIAEPSEAWDVYAGRENEVLHMRSKYVDLIVERKFVMAFRRRADNTLSELSYRQVMSNLLDALVAMFEELHPGAAFRVAFFTPNDDETFMSPVVWDSKIRNENSTVLNPDSWSTYFNIENPTSVVSRCWVEDIPHSRVIGEYNVFSTEQEAFLKSLFTLPVTAPRRIADIIKEKELDMYKRLGVLCIDSDNPNVFDLQNLSLNCSLIEPFAKRMSLETYAKLSHRTEGEMS